MITRPVLRRNVPGTIKAALRLVILGTMKVVERGRRYDTNVRSQRNPRRTSTIHTPSTIAFEVDDHNSPDGWLIKAQSTDGNSKDKSQLRLHKPPGISWM